MFDTERFIYMGNCEDYKDMVRRLKNLNKDLNGTDEESTDSFVRLCRLYEDKKLDLIIEDMKKENNELLDSFVKKIEKIR